jgi:hypothetical protein
MMTSSTLAATLLAGEHLLAAGNPSAAGRQADRVDTGETLFWLAVAGGTIALVCLAVRLVFWWQHRQRHNSQGSLFWGLCRTHGLNRRTRKLLRQVARHHRLRQPARLFTEPKWLSPANLPRALRQRAAEVAALRNRLFA